MAKVLIVGQLPPPYLGQPIMLEYLVRTKMPGVEVLHVNMGLSSNVNDVCRFRWSKVVRLLPIVVSILYARIIKRAQIMYYVPAVATRVSMFRDVVILMATRPFFPKTIFHFHASGYRKLYDQMPRWQQWLFRQTYFGVDAAVRISEFTPEDGKAMQAQSEYIVPNGITDPTLEVPPARAVKPVTQQRPLRLLFVALLCEGKGLLVLIEACGKLAARGIPFELDVLGRFHTEEFGELVHARIAELNLTDKIRFLGHLNAPEKFEIYAQADVLCHPTFHDTFPIVVLEAMAYGLPVVATRWSGIPSMVDDGETGYLVETHDPDAVAERVAHLAENDEFRERMGIAAREKFLREYVVSRYVERMRHVFLDVAGEACSEVSYDEQVEEPVIGETVHAC